MKTLQVTIAGQEAGEWQVEQEASHLQLTGEGESLQVDILDRNERGTVFLLNGKKYHVAYRNDNGCSVANRHLEVTVRTPAETMRDALAQTSGDSLGAHDVKVSMPGLVVKILVAPGDTVSTGDDLVIVEAMKMENVIKSPQSGLVGNIYVEAGQAIEKGTPLLHLGTGDGKIV